MKPSPARTAAAVSLALLANLFFASTAHVAEPKGGPRETVRIKRAPKQPETAQFAALQIHPAELSRPEKSDDRAACVDRIGPRNTITRRR
ncbi:MAG: hypothetical protein ACREV5_15195 [Steroidobacter sp.]